MVFKLPLYWDAALDGIQIILCLLILLFLLRIRKKKQPSALEKSTADFAQAFHVQVLSQTIKQQVDQAFANIAEAIAVEQRKLQKVIARDPDGHQTAGSRPHPSILHQPLEPGIAAIESEVSVIDQLHDQIQGLADKGLTARQISEELKTPLGEVELVLSLSTNVGN